jgi:hypothetical protein
MPANVSKAAPDFAPLSSTTVPADDPRSVTDEARSDFDPLGCLILDVRGP